MREVRDKKLKGFGLRVSASKAKRFLIHCQQIGERVCKIVDDAGTMNSAADVRASAVTVRASNRRGKCGSASRRETLKISK